MSWQNQPILRADCLGRLALVALAAGAVDAPQVQSVPTLDDLLARAGAYVRDLELQMAMVIGDEDYRQRAVQGRRAVNRNIHAETLFWWLDDAHVWISVRNVLTVDGKPVPDSKDRLAAALAASAPAPGGDAGISRSARLRGLQEESARFDVGTVRRTTSNPTEVLQYLVPENQVHFVFTREREEKVNGTSAWRISFREIGRPTVLQFGGHDVPTTGAVWLRPGDGVVLRTARTVKTSSTLSATVTVDFQRDPRLALWVPKRMEEEYGSLVGCRSDYSNYRRFETSGRIVPPEH